MPTCRRSGSCWSQGRRKAGGSSRKAASPTRGETLELDHEYLTPPGAVELRLAGQEVTWPTTTPTVRFRIRSVMVASGQDEDQQVEVEAAVPERGPRGAEDRPVGGGGEVGESFPGDRGGDGDDVFDVAEPGGLCGRD